MKAMYSAAAAQADWSRPMGRRMGRLLQLVHRLRPNQRAQPSLTAGINAPWDASRRSALTGSLQLRSNPRFCGAWFVDRIGPIPPTTPNPIRALPTLPSPSLTQRAPNPNSSNPNHHQHSYSIKPSPHTYHRPSHGGGLGTTTRGGRGAAGASAAVVPADAAAEPKRLGGLHRGYVHDGGVGWDRTHRIDRIDWWPTHALIRIP